MKTNILLVLSVSSFAYAAAGAAEAPTDKPNTPSAARVGIYDSRVVAFAYFWSAAQQQSLKERMAAARAAKAAGDQATYAAIAKEMKELQSRSHLQVFSTAPVDDAMAALQARLPQLAAQAGIGEFVSKWDEAALQKFPMGARVDVTDLLVQEFKLPEPQKKALEGIKRAIPVPLDEARRLDAAGKI
jgi:hypothetical protein